MKLLTKSTKIATGLGLSVAVLAVSILPVTTASAASRTATSVINGIINSAITITTSSPVNINVTPTTGAVLSSASDTVTVSTNNSTGYTLSLEMNGATNTLAKGTDTIAAHTAAPGGTPSDLATNSWGFRVDGITNFGTGPTTAETNVTASARTWAGVPAKGSPFTIKTTSAPLANSTTSVWYAMKADTSKPSGTYTNTVLYTAVTN